MMMRPSDPRIRQTINRFSHNLESANETAQEGLYTFSHNYVSPCLAAIGNCVHACTAPCLPSREDQLRRRRRGRAEDVFDFYDDWDNDAAGDGLLGWGNDELDRLLAGSGLARGGAQQPRRQRKMSYGTRNARRKSSVLIPDDRKDPTVIPSSSFIGFLERFPWRLGARGLKYRPSAADLQEHPHGPRRHVPEDEPLMEATEETEGGPSYRGHTSYSDNGRDRSATQSSHETNTSLSSRGDLILSDEEDDAVPLDDEFAMTLGRRGTGLDSEEQLGGKPGSMKRSTSGTLSLGTASSKESKKKSKRRATKSSRFSDTMGSPSIADLKREEERAALEEEEEITRRRVAAQKLAASRGLGQADKINSTTPSISSDTPPLHEPVPSQPVNEIHLPVDMVRSASQSSDWQFRRDSSQTEPFPPLPLTPSSNPEPRDTTVSTSPLPSQPPSNQEDPHLRSEAELESSDPIDPSPQQ